MASYMVWAVLLLAAFSRVEAIGEAVSIEEFPSIVQVEIGVAGLFWTQQCAGTVVTSFHVLSLASCFAGSTEYRRIRAGTDIRGTGGSIHNAASVNNHPDADFDADICVVRLETQLSLGSTIQQSPILGQGITLPTGLSVQLAGWGTTAEGGDVSSSQLFSLNLFVTDIEACALKYLGDRVVTENNICVGLTHLSGRDYDARDMGDPLYYQGTLVGLLSYGKRDANNEFPIISTSISSYTNWIIANAV